MRRVTFDTPAVAAGSQKTKAPGRRARDIRRAQEHRAKTLTESATDNATTLTNARSARRESWAYRTRNRQDSTIASSEQERRELRAAVRQEIVARNGNVADAQHAAQALHIEATAEEGAEFYKGNPEGRFGA